jgi:hypothetical protein
VTPVPLIIATRIKADCVPATVEGLFTICVSLILVLLLPGSPDAPKPLLTPGLLRFNTADREVLQKRLAQGHGDDSGNEQPLTRAGTRIPLRLVWQTVSHWRRWPHYVSTFAVFSTWSSLTTYTPSIMVYVLT